MNPFKPLSPLAIAASVPIALLATDLLSAFTRRRNRRNTASRPADPGPSVQPMPPDAEAAQSTLSALCRSVRDAILITDASGRVTQLNRSAEHMTGWTHAKAQGKPLEEVCTIMDEHTRRPLVGLAERVKNALPIDDSQQRLVLQHRAGHAVPIEARGDLIVSTDGSPGGIVLVLRDLSAVRAEETQGRILAARAEAACRAAEVMDRSRDNLLSFVAHQLRGPLNSIYGWVQLMQSGRLDTEQQTRALEAIARGTHAQTGLIDELQDASRALRGELRLERSTVDVGLVARAALDSVRAAAAAKKVVLDFALAHGMCVIADPQRLQQVLGNLLDNAIRSTPPEGSIMVQLLQDDTDAVVRVSDSGSGILAQDLPRIFEPFHRGETVDARHPGRGLGLELALAKRLTEQHGGRMEAHSAGRGQGATFTVRLPLLAPTLAPSNQDASTTPG